MFENKARVLLTLSQDALDRTRALAGKATTALKLPVSLQIVLRALIGEGLKQEDHPALFANIEGQAKAVRRKRSGARRRADEDERDLRSRTARGLSGETVSRRGRSRWPTRSVVAQWQSQKHSPGSRSRRSRS